MNLVPRIRTATDEASMSAILRDAYAGVFGDPPTTACLAVAWAQCALEHAHGAALDNHCYGNITATKDWEGDYYEIEFSRKGNPNDAPAGDAPTFVMRFRAFDDHIDGARNYWSFLQRHYTAALERITAGDPAGAAIALKRGGYFTANLDAYERAMVSLAGYFRIHVLPSL